MLQRKPFLPLRLLNIAFGTARIFCSSLVLLFFADWITPRRAISWRAGEPKFLFRTMSSTTQPDSPVWKPQRP